ncbi:hypothetical protein QJQ45_025836 [Haematococcus lacustris]|nr:hypothetical protein QJQ45_025836 [Haematococcus lacustris]
MPAQGARCDGGISGGGGASSSSNGGSSGGSTTGVGPCNNDGKHRVARQIVGDRGKRAAYQRIATRTMAAAVAEATETSTGVNSGNSGSSGGSGGRSSGNVDTSQQCRQSSRNVQVEQSHSPFPLPTHHQHLQVSYAPTSPLPLTSPWTSWSPPYPTQQPGGSPLLSLFSLPILIPLLPLLPALLNRLANRLPASG